jgi:hypothetical protein
LITNFSSSSVKSGVKRKRFWDQNAVANSYFSIATTTLSANQTTITFSNIPQTYTHLQLRSIARDNGASNDTSSFKITINGDTSSTYTRHILYGDGASAGSVFNQLTGFSYTGIITQNGATSTIFGSSVVDILDYRNTNKFKTIRSIGGSDLNGAGGVNLQSSLWQSTAAITSISLTSSTSTDFRQYSSFALYGVLA